MSARHELVGGPLDGITVAVQGHHEFVWVTWGVWADEDGMWVDGSKSRCKLQSGRCRALYRLRKAVYVYAGDTWGECGGCGGFVDRVNWHNVTCSLCGGAVARNVS